ncbi:hypothetical protein L209DRAFT_748467 [Thermothelomyces heterothallicus CBS 203.75]
MSTQTHTPASKPVLSSVVSNGRRRREKKRKKKEKREREKEKEKIEKKKKRNFTNAPFTIAPAPIRSLSKPA